MTTSNQKHGRPAETKPDTAIHTHHPNTREAKPNQGHKLYSKVLAIEPNRLFSKCSELNKGARSAFVSSSSRYWTIAYLAVLIKNRAGSAIGVALLKIDSQYGKRTVGLR